MTPDQLRAWRKQHELTQAAAAQALGVSVETWRSWEQGRRKVDRFKAQAIENLTPILTESRVKQHVAET